MARPSDSLQQKQKLKSTLKAKLKAEDLIGEQVT